MINNPVRAIVWIVSCPLIIGAISCNRNNIEVSSYILRSRVIVTDRVFMKKSLYVAYSINKGANTIDNLNVKGELLCNGERISACSVKTDERNGNLIFDLPYELPEGMFTIKINAFSRKGDAIAQGSLSVEKAALRSTFRDKDDAPILKWEEITYPPEAEDVKPTKADDSVGYVLFSRSPLEYVFPASRPRNSERMDRFTVTVVRNEFEPLTFSLYPLRDLGSVKISVSDLHGALGVISRKKIKVGHVESVQETRGFPKEKFQRIPDLIRPGDEVEVERGKCQRFWLTLRIDDNVSQGEYRGQIIISPRHGAKKSVPIKITVAPITLEDIPNVDYFMLMTYEFTELTMPWNEREKKQIYQSAVNVLKDYKEHGMTTFCIHSPFVLIAKEDGTANLEDIFAALRAAKDQGFQKPIIWYMGHLIQTSKPKHPGNILYFDKAVHLKRLKYLIKTVTEYARTNGYPDIIFLPIDEPDDAYQDVQNKRHVITPMLLKIIREQGAKSMLTARKFYQFGHPDYLCSGELRENEKRAAHDNGSPYWMYNNQVTTECRNPAYARYIYGYYTWKNNIEGMSSWTFQNTQNAGGLPTGADAPGNNVYLAYLDPKGPLPTLRWEAIREGIDDHKLIYQLMVRIHKLRSQGQNPEKYESFLSGLGNSYQKPPCQPEEGKIHAHILFGEIREQLIDMITDADAVIGKKGPRTPVMFH